MQSIIDTLTNNLVVAAFIPSFVFYSSLMLIFRQRISTTAMGNIVDLFNETGIFVVLLAFITSLLLVYLRVLVFRFYKGEYFPKALSLFEKHRATKLRKKIDNIKAGVEKCQESPSFAIQETELKDQWYDLAVEYYSNFPSQRRITSTRLGNILGAAEDCVSLRYKLDPIPLWPKLTQLMPAANFQKVEDGLNQLAFLVNSSFLSLVFCLVIEITALVSWLSRGSFPKEYTAISIVCLALFYLFYKLALPVAQNYAVIYCSAFDLFRFEILKQMKLELPENSKDESYVWRAVSELVTIGTEFGDLYFEYNHPDELPKQ